MKQFHERFFVNEKKELHPLLKGMRYFNRSGISELFEEREEVFFKRFSTQLKKRTDFFPIGIHEYCDISRITNSVTYITYGLGALPLYDDEEQAFVRRELAITVDSCKVREDITAIIACLVDSFLERIKTPSDDSMLHEFDFLDGKDIGFNGFKNILFKSNVLLGEEDSYFVADPQNGVVCKILEIFPLSDTEVIMVNGLDDDELAELLASPQLNTLDLFRDGIYLDLDQQ
jgi:hypothetical protein